MPARLLAELLGALVMAGWVEPRITVRADPPVLAWSDFRRVESMPDSGEDARIAAEMSFPQPLRVQRIEAGYRLPPFTITVAPEPRRTMVKRSVGASDGLLRHEQGHYDIVALAARALARELEELETGSAAELSRRVEECVDEHTQRADRLSRKYDAETDHGRDGRAQARWLRAIAGASRSRAARELAGQPL